MPLTPETVLNTIQDNYLTNHISILHDYGIKNYRTWAKELERAGINPKKNTLRRFAFVKEAGDDFIAGRMIFGGPINGGYAQVVSDWAYWVMVTHDKLQFHTV